MGIKICADCRVEMTCFKNGVAAVYGDYGHCYAGDLYVCSRCGHKLLFCNESPHSDPEKKAHDYYMKMNSGVIDIVENPYKLRANRFLEEIKAERKQEKEEKANDQKTIQQNSVDESGGSVPGSMRADDKPVEQEPNGTGNTHSPVDREGTGRKGSRYSRG